MRNLKLTPTLRQRKTMKIMVTNGGKLEPAMKASGFSKAYAESGKLAKTKTWKQLLDQYLPDDLLAQKAREGLDANRVISAINTGKDITGTTSDFIEVPDLATRHRYLETSLKMQNKLTEKIDVTTEGEKIGGFVVVKTEK